MSMNEANFLTFPIHVLIYYWSVKHRSTWNVWRKPLKFSRTVYIHLPGLCVSERLEQNRFKMRVMFSLETSFFHLHFRSFWGIMTSMTNNLLSSRYIKKNNGKCNIILTFNYGHLRHIIDIHLYMLINKQSLHQHISKIHICF